MQNYVSTSLEIHLFFLRIMREHALFLEAGFPCKDKEWIQTADWYRSQFEMLLQKAVSISDGRIHEELLQSGEFSTRYTVAAEQKTQQLSGVPIDSRITMAEQKLHSGSGCDGDPKFRQIINQLNRRALRLLNGLIRFKENLLRQMKECRIFNANYPLLVQHILREAKLYRDLLQHVMQNGRIAKERLYDIEAFWNQIMMEHALFIRGLLDPTEEELIETAGSFAAEYKELLTMAKQQDCRACRGLHGESLEETLKYREFKTAGTEGILDCKIDSVILPLLADHVLREANHYIRLLEHGYIG